MRRTPRTPANPSRRGPPRQACTRSAPPRPGPLPASRRRAPCRSCLLRLADVAHGDAPLAARALEPRQVDAELVGQADGRLGCVVLLGAPLLAALAQLAHLPCGGEPEVSRLIGGGVPDLACDGLSDLLGHLPGGRSLRRSAVWLLGCRTIAAGPASAEQLARALARLTERLADAADELVEVACGLPGALADVADGLSGPLPHVADSLSRALTDLARGLAGALAHVLERRLGALADILGGVTGLVHGLTRALAHFGDCPTEALQQLRVAIERRHQPIDDGRDVVKPRLEDDFGMDALHVELDAAEVDVDTDVQLDQVEHPGLERHVRVEIVHLEVDQVHLQLGHIEQDVGRADTFLLLSPHVGAVLAVGVVVGAHRLLSRAL